jgi:hypothetical protein
VEQPTAIDATTDRQGLLLIFLLPGPLFFSSALIFFF